MKRAIAAILVLSVLGSGAEAGEYSHYAPGAANLRDYLMPRDSGFYLSSYNFYYQSGRLNDGGGAEIPWPNSDRYADVDIYMTSIPLLLVQKQVLKRYVPILKDGNLDYGFLISPTFGNTSLSSTATIDGDDLQPFDSQFGFADLYVQPLWLGFAPTSEEYKDLFQLSFLWGFYAPTGKYDTEEYGTTRVADPDNIGAGFWTNQFRGALQLNPWKETGPGFILATTYEISSEKEDVHVTPGDQLTLNYGYSQFLPAKYGNWYVEFGPAGYSSWQVSNDSGRGRATDLEKDEVHAAGFQIGLTEVQCLSVLNFRYFYEYAAEDRFQGHVIGLSFTFLFKSNEPFRFRDYHGPHCGRACDDDAAAGTNGAAAL